MKRSFILICILVFSVSIFAGNMEKKYSPKVDFTFRKVSPNAVKPQGYWKNYMQTIADGWIKRMCMADDPTFATILYDKKWEELKVDAGALGVYAAGGIVKLGRMCPDTWLGKYYREEWLPKVLDAQLDNGYLGPGFAEGCYNMNYDTMKYVKTPIPKYELLNIDLVFDLLLYEYEYSGDEEVYDAIINLKDFVLENYIKPGHMPKELATPHWVAIFRHLFEVYEYSGDEKIIEYLSKYYDSKKNNFKGWMTKKRMHHHLPDLSYTIQAPLMMYHFTGDKDLLKLSEGGFENIENFALQTTGVPTGVEITLEKGCRKYTEHCGVVEWINACMRYLRSTGKVKYADIAEKGFYNAYFGSKSPDGLTLAYYHTMNQLFATDWTGQYLRDYEPSATFNGDYNMLHGPGCCNAITNRCFPQFARGAICESDDGYAITFYGPFDFKDNNLKLSLDTEYPFEDEVTVNIEKIKPGTTVSFRIPGWCSSADVMVNGEEYEGEIKVGRYLKLDGCENGDVVKLSFDIPYELDWDKTPAYGPGAAIVRGPLVFALPVSADWKYTGKGQPGPGNTRESYNVVPDGKTVWNLALCIDKANPGESVELVELADGPGDTWDKAPIGLKVKAKVVTDWRKNYIDGNYNTPGLPEKKTLSENIMDVTLVPFGFTQLRMTALPVENYVEKKEIKHGMHKADI